jgi:threonine/homoserine/homoserine lactone efflux protein
LLAVTPGPAVFYILTCTLAQGRRAGLASVAGVALGNLGNAIGASIGLAALFAVSTLAFTVVKYAGAAYLVYLGGRTLTRSDSNPGIVSYQVTQLRRIFRDGFMVALFNPKTTLFFAAFLPQFMSTVTAPMLQSVALGSLFVLIASCTDTAYVLTASALAPVVGRLRGAQKWGRYLSASAFIGLGVFTATTGSRAAK